MGNGQSHDDSDSGTEDELSGSEEEDEELEDEEDGKASPNNEPDGKASPEKSGTTSSSRENAAALLPGKPADAAESGKDAREGGAGGGEVAETFGNGGGRATARGRHGGEVRDAGSTFGAVGGSGGAADTVENTESSGNAGDWDLAWDDETDEEKEKAEGKAERKAERKAEAKAEEGKTAQTAKDGEREKENNAGATGSEATVAAATATAVHPSLLSATAAAVAAAAGSADPAAAAAAAADPAAASTTTPPAPLVPVAAAAAAAAATASSSPSPTAAAVKSAEGRGGMARAWDEFAEGKGASSFMDASRPLSSHPFMHGPAMPRADICTEFYIIRHGEAAHNVSTLIGGRSPQAALTPLGEQQAVLLGRYLRDYVGVRFHAIFSSPIERSKRTAILACQEMGVAEAVIRYADELQELSQGQWERQPRARIYQRGVLEQMVAAQPDFRAPGGESQRQVEFRMVEFVSNILFVRQHLEALASTPSAPPSTTHHPSSAPRSNLSTTPANGNSSTPASANSSSSSSSNLPSSTISTVNAQGSGAAGDDAFRVAVFSHGTAIRCLVRGVLGSDPHLTHNIGIDNTSISILRHHARKGWHLVKMNDTTHLILARGPLSRQDASS